MKSNQNDIIKKGITNMVESKNDKPWILVEVKNSANNSLSKNLIFFKKELNAPYAFQVLNTEEYVKTSCFVKEGIWMVPVKTFLSQLV